MNRKSSFVLIVVSVLSVLSTILVLYKSGYYKTVYYKLSGGSRPVTERPDYWAIRGWSNTVQKLHIKADVAFFGNSITCQSHFEEDFSSDSLSIINLGYPGDGLDGMMLRVEMLKSTNPDKIFLMAGINGLKDQTIKEFGEKYELLVKTIVDSLPKSSLFLESILPVKQSMNKNKLASNDKIIEANSVIRQIAGSYNAVYVDLHTLYLSDGEMNVELTKDGVHLKRDAYAIWADEIRKYMTR